MNRLKYLASNIKKNKSLQISLSVICLLLVCLYIYAYCTSLFNVYHTLLINDSIAKDEKESGSLIKVDKIEKKGDKYILSTDSDHLARRFTADLGSKLYDCVYDEENNRFIYNGLDLNMDSYWDNILEVLDYDDNFIYTKINKDYRPSKGLKNIQISKDFPLYEVYVVDTTTPHVKFRIDYHIGDKDEIESILVDNIYNIEIKNINRDENKVHVTVTDNFIKEIDTSEAINCTNLDTSSEYYSSKGDVVLKNISENYWVEFAINNSLQVVEISLCALLLLFIYTYKDGNFVLFSDRRFADVTCILLAVLFILTFITYILLGVRYE